MTTDEDDAEQVKSWRSIVPLANGEELWAAGLSIDGYWRSKTVSGRTTTHRASCGSSRRADNRLLMDGQHPPVEKRLLGELFPRSPLLLPLLSLLSTPLLSPTPPRGAKALPMSTQPLAGAAS